MDRAAVVQRIRDAGVIPVVRASSPEEALDLVAALRDGGLAVFEVTMTVPRATSVIERLAQTLGDGALVGAGSVLDDAAATACISAGARFIVSPALQPEVITACRRRDVAVIPGALTPTEIVRAWTAGADLVKVFPCAALGGASYIRSLKGPLPQIELVPTGGVTLANAAEFIAAGAAAVGVGGELADVKALRAGQRERIAANARAFVAAVQAARATRDAGA